MTRFGWKSWLVTATLAGVAAGLVTAARTPKRYRSEALIHVIPPAVPESYVRPAVTTPMSTRLRGLSERILSRSKLEQVIQEFDLYSDVRRHAFMEETAIEAESDHLLRVGFVGTNPRTVQQVADRLASMLVNLNLEDRELRTAATSGFLQAQLEDLRTRLIEQKRELSAARQAGSPQSEAMAIEAEVLEATFKDLLTRVEDSRLASNLERRQASERLVVIDAARLPERPFSPDRRIYAGLGAIAGLATAVLSLFGFRRSRRRAVA